MLFKKSQNLRLEFAKYMGKYKKSSEFVKDVEDLKEIIYNNFRTLLPKDMKFYKKLLKMTDDDLMK